VEQKQHGNMAVWLGIALAAILAPGVCARSKISVTYICSPITHICNKSISIRIFPERLKFSIIKPLFKKGDRAIPSNYRPISLLTAFSKVIEKALYNRLIPF
jgi:hypothetical protein